MIKFLRSDNNSQCTDKVYQNIFITEGERYLKQVYVVYLYVYFLPPSKQKHSGSMTKMLSVQFQQMVLRASMYSLLGKRIKYTEKRKKKKKIFISRQRQRAIIFTSTSRITFSNAKIFNVKTLKFTRYIYGIFICIKV